MNPITDIGALEALYGGTVEASQVKVVDRMTPLYRKWIMASQLCLLTTTGPEGTDGSPRGDDGPVVRELDPRTLAMPDWRGNNRMDSLRNIVADGRVSLMFMVPGSNNVVRINGQAFVTTDADLIASFERKGQTPRSVIVIEIGEMYFQCARALLRARVWGDKKAPDDLPSVGDLLKEATSGRFDGETYDRDWPARAEKTLW